VFGSNVEATNVGEDVNGLLQNIASVCKTEKGKEMEKRRIKKKKRISNQFPFLKTKKERSKRKKSRPLGLTFLRQFAAATYSVAASCLLCSLIWQLADSINASEASCPTK